MSYITKPRYEKYIDKWSVSITPSDLRYFDSWETANAFYQLNKAREDTAKQRRKEEEYG